MVIEQETLGIGLDLSVVTDFEQEGTDVVGLWCGVVGFPVSIGIDSCTSLRRPCWAPLQVQL